MIAVRTRPVDSHRLAYPCEQWSQVRHRHDTQSRRCDLFVDVPLDVLDYLSGVRPGLLQRLAQIREVAIQFLFGCCRP